MSIKFGNKNVKEMYFGNKKVAKVYFGSNLVWPKAITETWKSIVSSDLNRKIPLTRVTISEACRLFSYSFYTIYKPEPSTYTGIDLSISRATKEMGTTDLNGRYIKTIMNKSKVTFSEPVLTEEVDQNNKPIYRIDVTVKDAENGLEMVPGDYFFYIQHSKTNQYDTAADDLVYENDLDDTGYFTNGTGTGVSEGSMWTSWDATDFYVLGGKAKLDLTTGPAFSDDPVIGSTCKMVQDKETVVISVLQTFAGELVDVSNYVDHYEVTIDGVASTQTAKVISFNNLKFYPTVRFSLPVSGYAVSTAGNNSVTSEITISLPITMSFSYDAGNRKVLWDTTWDGGDKYNSQIYKCICVFRNGPTAKTVEVRESQEVDVSDLADGSYQLVCTPTTKQGNTPVSKYFDFTVITDNNIYKADSDNTGTIWFYFTPSAKCKLTGYSYFSLATATQIESAVNNVYKVNSASSRTLLTNGAFELASSTKYIKQTADKQDLYKHVRAAAKDIVLEANETYAIPISVAQWGEAHYDVYRTNGTNTDSYRIPGWALENGNASQISNGVYVEVTTVEVTEEVTE